MVNAPRGSNPTPWYRALFDATQMQNAAWNSLVVAVWTTVISSVLGTAAALGIARSKSAWVKGWDMVFMSPLVLPALAFGFAALIYLYQMGLRPSLVFLILGHVVVCVPFVIRMTLAALTQLDPALLDASESLGAGGWMTFRRVTLPLSLPGVIAGCTLTFAACVTAFVTHTLIGGARLVYMPYHIYSQAVGANNWPFAAALSVVFMIAVMMVIALLGRLSAMSRVHD